MSNIALIALRLLFVFWFRFLPPIAIKVKGCREKQYFYINKKRKQLLHGQVVVSLVQKQVSYLQGESVYSIFFIYIWIKSTFCHNRK